MTLAVDFRPKDVPPLAFGDDAVKMFVSGQIKGFEGEAAAAKHSLVATKRHFLYNRLPSQLRAVNRFTMKYDDFEAGAPIAQVATPHFESAGAVLLLRDGTVVLVQVQDMPDKSVKVSGSVLAKIADATALCVLQNQGTEHSAAAPWADKQILVFSGSITIDRIVPSLDGTRAEKGPESVAANKAWASSLGRVASCAGGPNGFVALCGSSGSVQIIHQTDLAAGTLSRPLSPHNEVGAQFAAFLQRDAVTSDADPTLDSGAANGASTVLLTAARGGHELRLWGIRGGGQIGLLQTVAFSGDAEAKGGARAVTVDPSGDIVLVVTLGAPAGTIIACEPDADRRAFRRITEWALPEGVPAVSCAACPNKDAAQRFCLFARTEKSLSRYTFDARITGAANVSGAAAAAAPAAELVDPAIAAAGRPVAADGAAAGVSGNAQQQQPAAAAPREVHAAVADAIQAVSSAHFGAAVRLTETSERSLANIENNIGAVLGVLRIPSVRQKSAEIAAEWANKVRRAIDETARQAGARLGGGAAAAAGSPASPAGGIAGFTPALAQTFYSAFLDQLYGASQAVVDHSLNELLEGAISKALDRSWSNVQELLDGGKAGAAAAAAVPRPTALPSFKAFSESIVANQTNQNALVKRQVEQNRRDLDMYSKVDAAAVVQAERYLAQVQTAIKDLDGAIAAAKLNPSLAAVAAGAGQAVTPANEEEVFAKVIKMAAEAQWKQATNIVGGSGSLSLVSRFFDAQQVEPYFETVCHPQQMAVSSFVSLLALLARGVASASPVALTARVQLLKRVAVPYSLALNEAEEAKSTAYDAEIKMLRGPLAGEVEQIRNELRRVNGSDRNTTRNATLAFRALGALIGAE